MPQRAAKKRRSNSNKEITTAVDEYLADTNDAVNDDLSEECSSGRPQRKAKMRAKEAISQQAQRYRRKSGSNSKSSKRKRNGDEKVHVTVDKENINVNIGESADDGKTRSSVDKENIAVTENGIESNNHKNSIAWGMLQKVKSGLRWASSNNNGKSEAFAEQPPHLQILIPELHSSKASNSDTEGYQTRLAGVSVKTTSASNSFASSTHVMRETKAPPMLNEIAATEQRYNDMMYRCDDKGYIVFTPGLVINDRFELVKNIGKGTFSRVFMTRDRCANSFSAIKVIRNLDKYQMAARTELKILRYIRDSNRNNAPVIHLSEHMYYKMHPVFVFPLYGRSLYRFMADNNFQPFRKCDAVSITQQICEAVAYVHSLGIICTDLKPENIVFVSDLSKPVRAADGRIVQAPINTQIRLIDFGSAVFDRNGWHTHLIQTRHYRAPEVMLNLSWSYAADVWSIGCMIVELINGKMLFNTHDTIDHLSQIETCIGTPVPQTLRDMTNAQTRQELFNQRQQLNMRRVKISPVQCTKLEDYFKKENEELLLLAREMLHWMAAYRVTAVGALQQKVLRVNAKLEIAT
jgi:hypothetical protein